MIFQDRTGSNLNRKKITIISQTPTEIIADIERADNPINEGTTINASVFNTFQENINLSNETSTQALENANQATTVANEAKINSVNALNIAGKASNDASNAISAAQQATNKANEAISSANTVTTIANQALEASSNSQEKATTALDNSNNAIEVVEQLETAIASIQQTANTAQTNANEAKSVADSANDSATNALGDASNALNKAVLLETWKNTFESSYLSRAYPVGSIYMSTSSTSPATLFGGTWQQLKDRFLIGAGGNYSVNSTSGSTTHYHGLASGYAKILYTWINDWNRIVLQTKENVSYSTNFKGGDMNGYSWSTNSVTSGTALGGTTDSASNMPPYLAVYMWKRTA